MRTVRALGPALRVFAPGGRSQRPASRAWPTAKSSDALGALPCLALLVASGLDPLLRHAAGRVLASGYLCCWLVAGYLAFWAR